MLELTLVPGSLLRKVTESIKDLVNEANFDCSSTGLSMQAIDPRREALASLLLRSEGFDHYRCDRNLSLGLNLHDMAKMLRYAGNDDIVTITADDDDQDKIAEFEMKLMDLGYKHLEIPETRYDAIVQMPSSELARIYKELSTIGDTGVISVTKERLKFSIKGDNGTANIVCKQNDCVHKAEEATIIKMERPVSLTFRMSQVTVRLASEVPIVVEYMIKEMGYLRFLLAPKIEDEVMVGHDTESVVKNKQPKKKLKTEPKSNENTKCGFMKIEKVIRSKERLGQEATEREDFKILTTNTDHLTGPVFRAAELLKERIAKRYGV